MSEIDLCEKCDGLGVTYKTCPTCKGENYGDNGICITCFGNGFTENDCDSCDDNGEEILLLEKEDGVAVIQTKE